MDPVPWLKMAMENAVAPVGLKLTFPFIVTYCISLLIAIITWEVPVEENPSCLQATPALMGPHRLSHTVPHVELSQGEK